MLPIINKTNRPIPISEIHKIIPANKNIYQLEDRIAYLYASKGLVEIVRPDITQLKNDNDILRNNNIELMNVISLMKRKKSNKKIDLVYPFDFKDDKLDEAIFRLNWSLKSLYRQKVNICVYVTSKTCIEDRIKYPVKYIHNYIDQQYYSRSKTINLAVKDFVKTEYFLVSDIDLVYHSDFINNVNLVLNEKDKPMRIVFYNINLNNVCDIKEYTYENCKSTWEFHYNTYPNCRVPEHGASMVPFPATGNGIFHLESFNKVGGFCEKFIGWGPEDWEFNQRISKINEFIQINHEGFNTFHIYHPRIQLTKEYSKLLKKNDKIFRQIYNH